VLYPSPLGCYTASVASCIWVLGRFSPDRCLGVFFGMADRGPINRRLTALHYESSYPFPLLACALSVLSRSLFRRVPLPSSSTNLHFFLPAVYHTESSSGATTRTPPSLLPLRYTPPSSVCSIMAYDSPLLRGATLSYSFPPVSILIPQIHPPHPCCRAGLFALQLGRSLWPCSYSPFPPFSCALWLYRSRTRIHDLTTTLLFVHCRVTVIP